MLFDRNVFAKDQYFPHRLRFVHRNVAQFFRNCKYAVQRVKKGYCDRDTWDMDRYLGSLLPAMLQDLADNTQSYPFKIDEEEQKDGQKWIDILHEMVQHFNNIDEDADNEATRGVNKAWEEMDKYVNWEGTKPNFIDKEKYDVANKAWSDAITKHCQFMESEKDKALDMLKKHFFDLWD